MSKNKNNQSFHTNDMSHYAHMLSVINPLRVSAIRSAIEALRLPPGSQGLDAGCGIGCHTFELAEATAPHGHVTGLDLAPELLSYARDRAKNYRQSDQISFQEGDLDNLPFENSTFDWVWSSDCVGYPFNKPSMFKELIRVVKSGGTIALLGWTSQQMLPGYPLLEARLSLASISSYLSGVSPQNHFQRALGWFDEGGLEEAKANTFSADIHAPFGDDIKDALTATFPMLWGKVEAKVSEEDWTDYQRFCLPESPDFILDQPDYYGHLTYSMFHGIVAK